MKDVAYGTKQVRITSELLDETTADATLSNMRQSMSFVGAPTADMLDQQLIANLERGQNIFEIHLTRVCFFFLIFYENENERSLLLNYYCNI
jgi:hypothetical protein